jgi:hypothetical protein
MVRSSIQFFSSRQMPNLLFSNFFVCGHPPNFSSSILGTGDQSVFNAVLAAPTTLVGRTPAGCEHRTAAVSCPVSLLNASTKGKIKREISHVHLTQYLLISFCPLNWAWKTDWGIDTCTLPHSKHQLYLWEEQTPEKLLKRLSESTRSE